jgi:probable addiction module antidote protein
MPNEIGEYLRAALATNDLPRICSAIDIAVHQVGVERVAEKAELDRTTLYRAFRLKNGPALETMVRVLGVLGLALTVEPRLSQPSLSRSHKSARLLTAAFRSRDLDRVVMEFAKIMKMQENVSEFARQTIRSRETLYRSFAPSKRPRFITLLTVLNAHGLHFSVESQSSRSKP